MNRRYLALAVLFVFVAGCGSATAGELLRSSGRSGLVVPVGVDPCPDPGQDGHPCGPSCPCMCCPGHAIALAVFVQRHSIEIPPAGKFRIEPVDDVCPKDVLHRIFHPPRD